MWNSLFWKDTIERVIATIAQVLIAVIAADGFNVLNADWTAVVATVGVAAALSFLKAVLAATTSGRTVSPASLAHDDRGL